MQSASIDFAEKYCNASSKSLAYKATADFTTSELTDVMSAISNKLESTEYIVSPGNFFLPIYATLAQVNADTYN